LTEPSNSTLSLSGLAAFLAGRRAAIQRIASTRRAWLVGLLLVLSGSIARNYDGAYLLPEWHVLLHGVVVSSANALGMFALVWWAAGNQGRASARRATDEGGAGGFWRGYFVFLTLFWMCSPMAWLYAIPYEHFLTPLQSIKANGVTLAIVSIWRVALIIRVFCVLWSAKVRHVLPIVLLFSSVTMAIASFYAPVPVVDFMGGMQHSPEDEALASMNFTVGFYALILTPLFLIAACVGGSAMAPTWSISKPDPGAIGQSVWMMLGAALLISATGLAWMQPRQQRRFEATKLLTAGQVDKGLAFMSKFEREHFPPIWDPPPRLGYNESVPSLEDLYQSVARVECKDWVVAMYAEKSWRYVCRRLPLSMTGDMRRAAGIASPSELDWHEAEHGFADWPRMNRDDVGDRGLVPALEFHLKHDPRMTEADRAVLRRWLAEP
jgi:hypothetical protein